MIFNVLYDSAGFENHGGLQNLKRPRTNLVSVIIYDVYCVVKNFLLPENNNEYRFIYGCLFFTLHFIINDAEEREVPNKTFFRLATFYNPL